MPPTTTAPINEVAAAKRFKMRLLNDEYMVDVSGNDGRYPKGAVLLADEETAIRWYEKNVAEPADPDEPTYGEVKRRVKREEFKRLAKPAEGVLDRAITRQSFRDDGNDTRSVMPPPMPTPRSRRRPDLAGAEVVTDTSDEE